MTRVKDKNESVDSISTKIALNIQTGLELITAVLIQQSTYSLSIPNISKRISLSKCSQ